MAEPNYSNREVDRMIASMKALIVITEERATEARTIQTETLNRIEKQTTKTNGRVTRLEKTVLIAVTATVVYLIVTKNPLVAIFTSLI